MMREECENHEKREISPKSRSRRRQQLVSGYESHFVAALIALQTRVLPFSCPSVSLPPNADAEQIAMRSNGSSAAAFEPVTALCLLSVCVNRQLVQQNSRPALKSLVGPSLCSRRRRPSPPSLAMAGPQKQVNLMDMPFPQLGAIKQQLDQVSALRGPQLTG